MQNLEIFSSMKIKLLLNDNKIEEAKLYIHTYFFKTMTHYCFIDVFNNNIQTIADKDLKIYIPSDLNNSIYLTENTVKKNEYKRFSVISYLRETEFFDIGNMCREKVNFNYPRGLVHIDGQKCLNFARSLKINPVNDYKIDDFKNEIHLINQHLLKVMCSGDAIQYEYFLNFIAFSVKGIKVKTALYIKSLEQAGKGIYQQFLTDILGDRMYKSSSTETITKYTAPLEGRCLVNFDELPKCSESREIQDCLKSLITESTFSCRNMYAVAYTQKNRFNVIITTNNTAINFSNSNNARYVAIDVSNDYIGNKAYFDKLAAAMNKKGVKEAYYKYLLEHYESNKNFYFSAIPNTKSRRINVSNGMPKIAKYIKETYFLKGKGMNIETKELLENYNTRYNINDSAIYLHEELYKSMKIVKKRKINKETNKRSYFFIIDKKSLYELYDKKGWFVKEYDIIEDDEDNTEDEQYIKEEQQKSDQIEKLETLLSKEREATKQLQEQIEKLKQNVKEPTIEETTIEEKNNAKLINEQINKIKTKKAKKTPKAKVKKTPKPKKVKGTQINTHEDLFVHFN